MRAIIQRTFVVLWLIAVLATFGLVGAAIFGHGHDLWALVGVALFWDAALAAAQFVVLGRPGPLWLIRQLPKA